MVRFAVLSAVFAMLANPSYGCSKRGSFSLVDLIFADVVLEANVIAYEADTAQNIATLKLKTIKTLMGFHKSDWTVDWLPSTEKVEVSENWSAPVLVALRGRITNNGEVVEAIIDKGCTRGAIFPTDKDPGRSFKASFERLGITRAKTER